MIALGVLAGVALGAAISFLVFYAVFFSARKNEAALRAQIVEDVRRLLDSRGERPTESGARRGPVG